MEKNQEEEQLRRLELLGQEILKIARNELYLKMWRFPVSGFRWTERLVLSEQMGRCCISIPDGLAVRTGRIEEG